MKRPSVVIRSVASFHAREDDQAGKDLVHLTPPPDYALAQFAFPFYEMA